LFRTFMISAVPRRLHRVPLIVSHFPGPQISDQHAKKLKLG
jgi:hypothetical protein